MKASDLATSDYIKLLVYGDSGTGKTILASSFPGPIEYWDFDGKISSAVSFYKKHNPELLHNIEVKQYAKFPKETRIAEWEKRMGEINKLRIANAELPFKTLVLDSLTTFVNSILDDYIHRSQRGIKRALADIPAMQDYQLLDKHMSQIISSLLSLDCHIVMTGHMSINKDETTGAINREVLMPGKFASKLPIYFEEVHVSKVDPSGNFVLQTRTDATFKCRSQRHLAPIIPASFKSIQGS